MATLLERACVKLGVSPEQVLKHRLEGDSIVLVVDKGIAGCPKFVIPLSDLPEQQPQAEQQPEKEEDDASTSTARSHNRGRRGKNH